MKSRFAKLLPWGLTVLLAIICGRLLYGTIDQAVTLDHRNQQCILVQKQRDVLWYLAGSVANGMTKERFLNLIKERGFEFFPKGDDQIIADQMGFIFENDRLARIETCDDLEACR
jgi:hypothetical protein